MGVQVSASFSCPRVLMSRWAVGDEIDMSARESGAGPERRGRSRGGQLAGAHPEPEAGRRPDAPLASRIRPRGFDELVGQRKVVETLRSLATSGHLPS